MANRLLQETSPYLLQHAHNPVDWYPWGPEALKRAQEEDKPLLVSIGYAACHWCHVMERESFENEEVAKIMNEKFICIKVDREERPDIDQIYMDAVQLMTQRGGWPLNAFALPDGRPIYGGTYFPKDNWTQVLNQVSDFYHNQREKSEDYALNLVAAMEQMDQVDSAPGPSDFSPEEMALVNARWTNELDRTWGGRMVQANKFPLPQNNLFLLRSAFLSNDPELEQLVALNLTKMAQGGIYDQLGGGFSRYSVDKYWKVPHFEKMLYDNGQLVSLYAEAYRVDPQPLYRKVVEESIGFILRELTSPEGGFYSSLDADSEGVEGKFYTWTFEEVMEVLGESGKTFADYFNVHPNGNWEETNVLFVLETEEEFAHRWGLDPAEVKQSVAESKVKMMAARDQRIRPGLDDKILTSWNALMLKGLVDAYVALGDQEFLEAAIRNAEFLRSNLWAEGRLYRNYKEGTRTIPGFLEDYAFLADALFALYQATFDEQWLNWCLELVEVIWARFPDAGSGLFFFTSDEADILVRRKVERQDDVTPSSNSVLANLLHELGLLMDRDDFRGKALDMIGIMRDDLMKLPPWHAGWAQFMLKLGYPHFEVAITGPEVMKLRQQIASWYYPNTILSGALAHSDLPILRDRFFNESTIFVCTGHTCKLPVHDAESAVRQMMGMFSQSE
ncbi:thioredoxin domain-containing protein [Pontibacter sp. G13]|uniref:thioredoxin domain-containing protein n=1 Tax=Pontibacter sp. G13 TaxID=3074898 RepID=UPI00288B885D|nr:thioredoxin domain-containing protein [Pontibacter sp. G13]WNJ16460.1 thioredoxin domain-containing protein [Pontibacter sp. G13]